MCEMKDSRIEWLGEIPDTWSLVATKYLYDIESGATPKSDISDFFDGDIIWITPADYKTEDVYVSNGRRSLTKAGFESCSTSLIPENSIIFSKRAPIGEVAINTVPICTNQGCLSCVSKTEDDVKYYYYLMSSCKEQYNLLGSGTTFKEISATNFSSFIIPHPSTDIQKKISRFLDAKCVKVDTLIANQQSQIEKLKSYKQSLITEVVTKGLDKNVTMKDSGVEWIGEIPETFSMMRMKNLGYCRNGLTYSPENLCDENGTLVLRSSNVQNGKLCFDDNVYVDCEIKKDLMVKKGDIIICSRNGSKALIGKSAIVEEDIKASFGAFMMIFRSEHNSKYIYYILNSNVFTYYLGTYLTATINQLTGSNFNGMMIPFCPDEEEQLRIIRYLDDNCKKIEKLISLKQQKIEKLQQYKKSLIYEYVTGKKEVK